MSQIRNELNAESVPLYSIRLTEAFRVFDIIQQNVSQPKNILTKDNISQFLAHFVSPQLQGEGSQLLQNLKAPQSDLNSERFAVQLAKYLARVELTNEQSLENFYLKMKQVFMLSYQQPREDYEGWDLDSEGMTQEHKSIKQKNIGAFYNEISPFIDSADMFTFQAYLERLNYCLTAISVSQRKEDITKIYLSFMVHSVMSQIKEFLFSFGQIEKDSELNKQLVQNVLSQASTVANYLELIAHFYSACKFQELKERLQGLHCLCYNENFRTIMIGLRIPETKIQQMAAVSLCMASCYLPAFNQWILSDLSNNLMPFLSSMSVMNNENAAYYSLFCLKNILSCYQKTSQSFKQNSNNKEMLAKIEKYCFHLLQFYNNLNIQKQCILVIAEVLKVSQVVVYDQIESLKIITNIFSVQLQFQLVLFPAVLAILEVSIHKSIVDITNMIINDPAFIKSLEFHFVTKSSALFYPFWHIVYLLSFSHPTYLFEKNVVEKTLEIMQNNPNSTLFSIGSEILTNLVESVVENQKFTKLLYDNEQIFQKILPMFYNRIFYKSECVEFFFTQNGQSQIHNYFDKQIIVNYFKILYTLAYGFDRRNKKYAFIKRVSLNTVEEIYKILEFLFALANQPIIQLIFRGKVKISNNKKIKLEQGLPLYKIVSFILSELSQIGFKQSTNQEMRNRVNRLIYSYGRCLIKSSVLTVHEIEVENIPLFLKVKFQYDRSNICRRFILHKAEIKELKSYGKKLVISTLHTDAQSAVRDVILKCQGINRIIENQVQYRNLVKKALQKKEFELTFELDVRMRQKKSENMNYSYRPTNSFYQHPGDQESSMYRARGPGNERGYSPNFAGSRSTNTGWGGDSRYSDRRNHSPHNYNYTYNRGKSPEFGNKGATQRR